MSNSEKKGLRQLEAEAQKGWKPGKAWRCPKLKTHGTCHVPLKLDWMVDLIPQRAS